jgi:hypothetical protein
LPVFVFQAELRTLNTERFSGYSPNGQAA